MNHLFWLNDIEFGISVLCDVYNLAVRYGEYEFANRLLGSLTSKEWLQSRLSNDHHELITSLQHFGNLIGKYGDLLSSVAALKEQIFDRLDHETKIITLIDDANIAAKANNLKLASGKLLQAEQIIQENSFSRERAVAYRTMGIAARRNGDISAALEYLNRSFTLDGDVYTLIEIGHTKTQNNEKEEAIRIYNEVLKINPSLSFLKENIEALSRPQKSINDDLAYQLQACYSRLNGLTKGSRAYYRTHSRLSKLLLQQGKLQDSLRKG